jgi:hypothetical protein
MITKHILPLFAVMAVFLVVAVPYTSAAGEDLIEKQITYSIDSEYQDEHDRVVNIADESAITNPDTWKPSPQGIWIGASTEESLYQFDQIMAVDNVLQVHSHVRFNSTQVMNGASTTIIRSPIASDNVSEMRLRVWALSTPEWELRYPFSEYPFLMSDEPLAASVDINMADTSITDGGDQWTVDGRTYILLYGPLYSGIDYVFSWAAIYEPDSRPAVYLSGQDIANDNITDTQISVYSKLIPDQPYEQTYRWSIDPGISFDFQQGLGNGVYAQSFYMGVGDSISVVIKPDNSGADPSYYHTVMIPWATADGHINAKVTAEKGSGNGVWTPYWEDNRTAWDGYILACSDEKVPNNVVSFIRVTVTFLSAERVNWICLDGATSDFSQTSYYNNAIVTTGGIEHKIQSRLYASYQKSVGEVFMPSMNPADFPAMPGPKINERGNYYGTIMGFLLIVAGGLLVSTVFLAPIGFFVGGAGAVMLTQDLMSGGNFFSQNAADNINNAINGLLSNPLDKLRDALGGIGKFIISVGEAFYDGLKWFVDATKEYIPILLGLLIVAVALYIFFYAIKFQLQIWGICFSMAKGNMEAAAGQAEQLHGQVSGALGRLRRT